MEIQIETHTMQRAKERGAIESEIIETINTGTDIAAKYGRTGKSKVFLFNNTHGKKYHAEKKLEVYYQCH